MSWNTCGTVDADLLQAPCARECHPFSIALADVIETLVGVNGTGPGPSRAARSCKYKLLPSSTDLTREQPHGNAASCSFIASTSQNKKVFTWKDENKKQT